MFGRETPTEGEVPEMKYLASILLAFSFLLTPAISDVRYHYPLFEDFQKSGDVAAVKEHSDFHVTYELNYPYWMVRNKTIGIVEDCPFGLVDYEGEEEDGRCVVISGYDVKPLPEKTQASTGMAESRLGLVFELASLAPNKTALDVTLKFDVRNSSVDPTWKPIYQRDQLFRGLVGGYAADITLACRYTVNKMNQIKVREAYRAGKRDGVAGYKLPPADPVSRDTGYSVIRFRK